MDASLSHAEYEQLAAGYVLGALEPDDEHAFSRHLSGCATCQATVRALEGAAASLAAAVPPVEPPATLRASIRRKVGLSARHRGLLAWRPRPSATVVTTVAVAAGIVALFALSFWNMALRTQVALDRARLATYQQVLDDPNVRTARLKGDRYPQASATVLASSTKDRGLLLVERLPTLPDNRVYQVWGIPVGAGGAPGPPTPGRTFQGSDRVQVIPVGMPIQPQMTFAITAEPGPRGSQRPTGPPLLQGATTA